MGKLTGFKQEVVDVFSSRYSPLPVLGDRASYRYFKEKFPADAFEFALTERLMTYFTYAIGPAFVYLEILK